MKSCWVSGFLAVGLCTSSFAQQSRITPPRNLTATGVSTSEIDLAWTDASNNETGFRVESATSSRGPWSLLVNTAPNAVSFADTGLVSATARFYRVRAFNATASSRFSNIASASTQSGGGTGNTNTVGYIGASVTADAIEGYFSVGGDNFWPSAGPAIGGGSISKWAANNGLYWQTFDQMRAQHPGTKIIWWELVTSQQNAADNFDNAVKVVTLLRQRIPDAVLYVSAQEDYSGGSVCDNSGADGPVRMQTVVDQLVAGGYALPGPVMGPLGPSQLRDECHADTAGKQLLGNQLRAFFD